MRINDSGNVIWEVETGYIDKLSNAQKLAERLTNETGEEYRAFKNNVLTHYVVMSVKDFKKSRLLPTVYKRMRKYRRRKKI